MDPRNARNGHPHLEPTLDGSLRKLAAVFVGSGQRFLRSQRRSDYSRPGRKRIWKYLRSIRRGWETLHRWCAELGRSLDCRVGKLKVSPTSVTFTYTAEALPFCVPPAAEPALKWIPFQAEMNREELRIAGLAAGSWQVTIDDQPVKNFDAAELAKGVNLSGLPTPQNAQARGVLTILEKRWQLLGRLRLIAAVEFQHGGDRPFPRTVEALSPALAEWEKKLEPEPPNHWQRNHPARYREWKPMEAAIRTEAEGLLLQARIAAAPKPRFVRVTRVESAQPASR